VPREWDEECGANLSGLYSLVATCDSVDVDPVEYLKDVVMRVDTHPASRIDEAAAQVVITAALHRYVLALAERRIAMSWIKKRTYELLGPLAPAALEILYGPMDGVPPEYADRIRREMLWLSNGDIEALRALQVNANRDWRDIEGLCRTDSAPVKLTGRRG
jgi:hypothetical protein